MKYTAEDVKIDINDLIKTREREAIILKLGLNENKVKNFEITRSSLDSRFHNSKGIFRVYSVRFDYEGKLPQRASSVKKNSSAKEAMLPMCKNNVRTIRPVIIGAGPAGLFAALRLIEWGYKPIIIEMGKDIEERSADIKLFWETGELNEESNVQFGLGGAGAFSDGKLNSRIKSPYAVPVLETFVRFGAKRDIVYLAKPHLGTDVLKKIIAGIRDYIIKEGGEFMFSSFVSDLIISNERICGVIINGATEILSPAVVLACGNASRATYEMLAKRMVALEAKPFAIGVRVEHPQKVINSYTYGKYASHPLLSAAEYKLTYRDSESGRGVYSFCNCPGGYVINASSEKDCLAVNGMSYHRRNAKNANSAIVVSVSPADYATNDALSGVMFQRKPGDGYRRFYRKRLPQPLRTQCEARLYLYRCFLCFSGVYIRTAEKGADKFFGHNSRIFGRCYERSRNTHLSSGSYTP